MAAEIQFSVNNITEVTYNEITKKELESATYKFSNWKSPRLDKLHNIWWNKLWTLHPKVAIAFDTLTVQPESWADWLTTGQIKLIAKKKSTRNPSNYQPITCLPVMYNILSSIVTSRMPHHIDAKKIILNELKGKASNTYGSIDQLIINKKVMYNLKLKQWNISAACIHYKKSVWLCPSRLDYRNPKDPQIRSHNKNVSQKNNE